MHSYIRINTTLMNNLGIVVVGFISRKLHGIKSYSNPQAQVQVQGIAKNALILSQCNRPCGKDHHGVDVHRSRCDSNGCSPKLRSPIGLL